MVRPIMQITYGINDIRRAERDVVEVYRLAEKRLGAGCMKWNREELRNAFQVLRYAVREWAADKPRGVVWKMLMFEDCRAREVKVDNKNMEEQVIYCADADLAEVLEELIRKDGYEAEGD